MSPWECGFDLKWVIFQRIVAIISFSIYNAIVSREIVQDKG